MRRIISDAHLQAAARGVHAHEPWCAYKRVAAASSACAREVRKFYRATRLPCGGAFLPNTARAWASLASEGRANLPAGPDATRARGHAQAYTLHTNPSGRGGRPCYDLYATCPHLAPPSSGNHIRRSHGDAAWVGVWVGGDCTYAVVAHLAAVVPDHLPMVEWPARHNNQPSPGVPVHRRTKESWRRQANPVLAMLLLLNPSVIAEQKPALPVRAHGRAAVTTRARRGRRRPAGQSFMWHWYARSLLFGQPHPF